MPLRTYVSIGLTSTASTLHQHLAGGGRRRGQIAKDDLLRRAGAVRCRRLSWLCLLRQCLATDFGAAPRRSGHGGGRPAPATQPGQRDADAPQQHFASSSSASADSGGLPAAGLFSSPRTCPIDLVRRAGSHPFVDVLRRGLRLRRRQLHGQVAGTRQRRQSPPDTSRKATRCRSSQAAVLRDLPAESIGGRRQRAQLAHAGHFAAAAPHAQRTVWPACTLETGSAGRRNKATNSRACGSFVRVKSRGDRLAASRCAATRRLRRTSTPARPSRDGPPGKRNAAVDQAVNCP